MRSDASSKLPIRYQYFSVPGGLEVRDTKTGEVLRKLADITLARKIVKELNGR